MKNRNVLKQIFPLILLPFIVFFYACNKMQDTGSVMFMNDNQHTGRHASPPVKTEPEILWKVKTGGQVFSSPVVVGDMLYIGSNDKKLYAIEASSGNIKWEYKTGGYVNSTPAVSKGKVMFLSYDGFFYALNRFDGEVVWKFKTGGEFKHKVKDYFTGNFIPDAWDVYLSSAIVNNNIVYFGSSDSNVYALDIESGKMIWSHKTGGNIHSSPALYKNSLVVGSWDSRIYCLNASTGKEKWTFTSGRDTAQYVWLGIQASPSLDSSVVYIGSRDAKVYALNLETGDSLWTQSNFNKSWMPSSAAIGKKNIYIGSSDALSFYSISKKTGKINYKTETNSYTFSSPAIDNNMAYIGSANGRLYGIELDSGEIKWEFKTIGNKADTMNVFNEEGKMIEERMKELYQGIKDMTDFANLYMNIFTNAGSIFSSPTISNQVIYFGSLDGYVYAITDKP